MTQQAQQERIKFKFSSDVKNTSSAVTTQVQDKTLIFQVKGR